MINNNKVLIICILLITLYLSKNFLTKNMISGTYVSNNMQSLIDGPNNGDTLKIYNDNRFESQTWGKGNYELKHSIGKTKIDLNYKYEFGDAGYEMNIYRPFFGKPRIELNHDLEYYFEKID